MACRSAAKLRLLLLAPLLVPLAPPPAAARDSPKVLTAMQPGPNCTCRAPGRSFEVGESTCLRTGEGARMAQCTMELNVTSWRVLPVPCPDS